MHVLRLGLIALFAAACGSVSVEDGLNADAGIDEDGDAGSADADSPDAEPIIRSTVFVTSSGHAPDFGSRQDADDICTNLASSAGLGGNYIAWLSEGVTGAAERLPTNRQWRRVDGAVVADSLDDLLDATLAAPISIDETGAPYEGGLGVYTGARATGQAGASSKCGNWSALSTESVLIGDPLATDGSWTESDGNCGRVRQLYCFEI